MIVRLGKNTRKKIVDQIDSVKSIDLCNRIFCSWDHRVKTTKPASYFYLDYTKALYLRLFNSKLHDFAYELKLRQQPFTVRLTLFTKRLLTNIFILCLFALAGYAFIELNLLAANAKSKSEDRYLILLYEFIPAILLKSINIILRQVCQSLLFSLLYFLKTLN